jgi:hypothetical protein
VTTSVDRTGHHEIRITEETGWARRALWSRTVRYLAGLGVGIRYGVHDGNIINLARAVVERILYVPTAGGLKRAPQPKAEVFSMRLRSLRNRLFKVLRPTPVVTLGDYPDLYTGRKKEIYKRAVESLTHKAINFTDAYVSTFVKAEKVNLSKKADPIPRPVQPRSPRYNASVGIYLKKFEKELLRGFWKLCGYNVILKGMNAGEVGEQMKENWDAFSDPVAVGLDASKFDQHVSEQALKYEHSIYNGVFRSKELRSLLKMQLRNHGIGRVGLQKLVYDTVGCRMSGDLNTGMGNCLIMCSIVIAFCEHVGLKFRLANNGDDCVLFLEKADLHLLAGVDAWFLDFGFSLTQEEPVSVLEKVVFCQAQPVRTSTGWRMVRDPRVAMSKDCVSLLGWDTEEDFKAWAYAIGSCGNQLTIGVPVWNAWYSQLLNYGKKRQGAVDAVYDSGLGYMSKGVTGGEIDDLCRYSFYLAFDIEPDLQEALEQDYSQPMEVGARCNMISYPEVTSIDTLNPLTQWLNLASKSRCP